MKLIYTRVQDLLNKCVDDASCRASVLSVAVGLAFSRYVPVPSAPVNSPAGYYNTQVLETVTHGVGEINEHLVFDLREALNRARQFWMLRYGAAHTAPLPIISTIGFVDTIVNRGIYLDDDLVCFANDHKEAILRLTNEIECLIQNDKKVT
jgi:hypothetical protein